MLPRRIPKKAKSETRWRSQAHTGFVRGFACCNCGSMTNVVPAHVRIGARAGVGQKPDDWRTVPLCDGPFANRAGVTGCHTMQHAIGEHSFWADYAARTGQTVWQLIDELCAASPKKREIADIRRTRELAA